MRLSITLWACAFVIWVVLPSKGSGTQGGSEIEMAEPSTKKHWFSKHTSNKSQPGTSDPGSASKPLTKKEKKALEKAKKQEEEEKKKKPKPREPREVYGFLTDGQLSSIVTMTKAMLRDDWCSNPEKKSSAKSYCARIVSQLDMIPPEMRPESCPQVTGGTCVNGVCSLKVYRKTKGCGCLPTSVVEKEYRSLSSCVIQPVEVPPQYC